MEYPKKELQRKEAEQDSDPRVDLAIQRTEFALERTQLAWIRTTLTFLASGIGLDKGMEAIHKTRLEAGNALSNNAHAIGITLSIAATLLLSLVTLLYIRRLRRLARMKGVKPMLFPPGSVASFLIILLGAVISFLLVVT
jgi:putative membrane protein